MLHVFGSAHAEHFKAVGKYAPCGQTQRQTRVAFGLILHEHALGVVEGVKVRGKLLEVHADQVRGEVAGGDGKRFAVARKLGGKCGRRGAGEA